MRKVYLFLMIFLFSLGVQAPSVSAKNGQIGTVTFTYDLSQGYSEWHIVDEHLKDGDLIMGEVAIYNDLTHIHLWAGVWSKDWLAQSELDKNGDGEIDDDMYDVKRDGYMKGDRNKDRSIDKFDLKSDGIIIMGLGDHPEHDGYPGHDDYRWFVDSDAGDNPTKYRDDEISVPSWTDDGMLEGPIVYEATIPIPSGDTVQISLVVHASKPEPEPFPEFHFPEFPLGTLSAVIASVLAIVLFSRLR